MQFAALPALNKSKISEASETRDAHKKKYIIQMDIWKWTFFMFF